MGGVRMGGTAAPASVSPPYVINENATAADSYNVWRVINGTPTRITPYFDPVFADVMGNPLLSPNGLYVVYDEHFPGSGGSGVIDMVPANGGSVTRLFDSGDGDYAIWPSWHPDSDLVVFSGGGNVGTREGAVMTVTVPGGVTDTLWTPAEAEEGAIRPKFSPDGTMIAFIVNVDTGGSGLTRQGLWVMDADGSNDQLIRAFGTSGDNGAYTYAGDGPHLAWSHDSEWIAFVDAGENGTGATWSLSKIRPDGTDELQLGAGDPPNNDVWRIAENAWLPDNSAVIAYFNDGSDWGIFRAEADGTGDTLLVDGATNTVGIQVERGFDNRIYWKSQNFANLFMSSAIDGSDVRTEHDITDVSNGWTNGTGLYRDPV